MTSVPPQTIRIAKLLLEQVSEAPIEPEWCPDLLYLLDQIALTCYEKCGDSPEATSALLALLMRRVCRPGTITSARRAEMYYDLFREFRDATRCIVHSQTAIRALQGDWYTHCRLKLRLFRVQPYFLWMAANGVALRCGFFPDVATPAKKIMAISRAAL